MDEPMDLSNQYKKKLLLHCECGLPPYLSPHLLSQYFPPDNKVVRNHLVFGIEVRDSCIVPEYNDRSRKTTTERKRRRIEETNNCGGETGESPSGDGRLEKQGVQLSKSNKPTGYKFVGRPASKHLCVPSGYETMVCPTFDLLDSDQSKVPVQGTSSEVALSTPNGFQKLSSNCLFDVVDGLEISNSVSLYDQVLCPGKRNKKSVDRTVCWLKTTSAHWENYPKVHWWAAVVGGEDRPLRDECLNQVLEQNCVHGLALVGVHHIKSRKHRKDLMSGLVGKSSKTMPKALLVAEDVSQILDAIQSGISVVGTSLPTVLARKSMALTLDLSDWGEKTSTELGDDSRKDRKGRPLSTGCIKLDDEIFARDPLPFLENCSCVACVNHTRSYVHHLINAHEILSEILIFNHNLHHLLKMFEQMSLACEARKLENFQQHIESQLY